MRSTSLVPFTSARFPAALGLAFASLAAAGALAGCEGSGDTINETDVTRRLAIFTEQMVKESGRSVGFAVSDDGTAARALDGTASSVEGVTNAMTAPMMSAMSLPAPLMRALMGRQVAQQLAAAPDMPSMMTAEEQFDDAAAELRTLFDQRLFVASNLEVKNGGTAVYLLRPDPTCRPLPLDSDPPGTIPAIDMDCMTDLDKVQVRLAVREDGDGGRITVLIGPDRLELAVFIVHSDRLEVQTDLARSKAASDYVQQQLGTDAPTDAYARLAGKIGLSLQKMGSQRVTAAMSILAALDVATLPGGSSDPVEFTTAAADPLFSISGDGVSKTATVQVGVGQTTFTGPWDPQSLGTVNRDLVVSVGGIYGRIDIDENAKRIGLTDVGVGQIRVQVRGTPIFDLNLNPTTMRRFSGAVTVAADNTTQIEINPQFDLSLGLDYASIAAELSAPPPEAALHDTYSVLLQAPGGSPAAIAGVPSGATMPSGGIKVVAGTLTLGAASVPAQPVVVPTGKCLFSQSPAAPGSNPFLGTLQVIDCP